jgi:hypothetical protein
MSTDAEFHCPPNPSPVCVPPPPLPDQFLIAAAEESRKIHPANAPPPGAFGALSLALESIGRAPLPPPEPLHIAMMTQFFWGPEPRTLTVSFTEQTSQPLKDKILAHLNMWKGGLRFKHAAAGARGDVRISRGPGGYFSYLGNSILQIPKSEPTMNLEGFSLQTADSEFVRVICHEGGHTRGYAHEHMLASLVGRLNREAVYRWAARTQGWSRQEVDQQIFTTLDERSIMATPADQTSIMCYHFDADLTIDGQPILGGDHINETDQTFDLKQYPVAVVPTPTPTPGPTPTPTPAPTPTPTPTPAGSITIPLGVTVSKSSVVSIAGQAGIASVTNHQTLVWTPR